MSYIAIGVLALVAVSAIIVMIAFGSLKSTSPVTWILGELLLLILAAGVAVLIVMPSWIEIDVAGTPGIEFVAEITVDGVRHELLGVTPQKFEYPARSVAYTIIRTAVDTPGTLEVHTNGGTYSDDRGVKGFYQRQAPFGSSCWQGGLADDEWQEAAARSLRTDATASTPALCFRFCLTTSPLSVAHTLLAARLRCSVDGSQCGARQPPRRLSLGCQGVSTWSSVNNHWIQSPRSTRLTANCWWGSSEQWGPTWSEPPNC